MNKKTKIIIASIISAVLVIGTITGIIIFNKLKDKEQIEVTALEVLSPLEQSDSSKAANQTIKNVVKITNKLNEKQTIYGTGFFDKSGYLVTNSHVVDIKGDITIEYQDGTNSKATLFSNDIKSDIALLSVENVKVKALPTKSTIDLDITDEVYSIGYQLNLKGNATVTKGILSSKRVSSGIEFLQTDSAVNSGGSGGPVINDKGEVLGMVTLASDNATLSFAISSDTLELYISKLIKEAKVTYITEKRETNSLSVVLKEVNYVDDDIYDEQEYFEKDDDKDEDDDKDDDKDDDDGDDDDDDEDDDDDDDDKKKPAPTPSKPIEQKDYSLVPYNNTITLTRNSTLDTNINTYFNVGKDLTNCKLDTSKIDQTVGGEYQMNITCDQKSSSIKVVVLAPIPPNKVEIPTVSMDETKNNVTSFEQVKGFWYYPGYKDVCIGFTFNVDSYSVDQRTYDPYNHRLSYNTGGGSGFYTFEEVLRSHKLWVQGDWLWLSTNGKTTAFTRKPGVGVYNESHLSPAYDNWCKE